MADNASAKNARNVMLMAAAEASVNMLSDPSLMRFVKGTAEDAADIKRYAIICNQKFVNLLWIKKSIAPQKSPRAEQERQIRQMENSVA
jgi:hypothetical protein